jgi:choline-sulfatase|tara:strand:+ start:1360 stop:1608 length:249 start_codon:yes stop_codon:yes gene_type:complete
MYEEPVGVPMLLAGLDVPEDKVVKTPVSLADVFPTILDGVDVDVPDNLPCNSLFDTAAAEDDNERIIFSEYHGAAVTSGAFM